MGDDAMSKDSDIEAVRKYIENGVRESTPYGFSLLEKITFRLEDAEQKLEDMRKDCDGAYQTIDELTQKLKDALEENEKQRNSAKYWKTLFKNLGNH